MEFDTQGDDPCRRHGVREIISGVEADETCGVPEREMLAAHRDACGLRDSVRCLRCAANLRSEAAVGLGHSDAHRIALKQQEATVFQAA